MARLLGIPNLIHATVTGPGVLFVGDPGALPADGTGPADGQPARPRDAAGLLIAAETGDLPAGAEVLWSVRPDHITVLPGPVSHGAVSHGAASHGAASHDVGGGQEAYPAIVGDVADIGTLTTLTVRLRTGQDQEPELRVRTTAVVTLAEGDPCVVRLLPADITAWPATQAPASGDGAPDPHAPAASHTR